MVTLESSTRTRRMSPWLAMAILELEVPKYIPQEIVVIFGFKNLGAQFLIIPEQSQSIFDL